MFLCFFFYRFGFYNLFKSFWKWGIERLTSFEERGCFFKLDFYGGVLFCWGD